jgi:hypothetical protein
MPHDVALLKPLSRREIKILSTNRRLHSYSGDSRCVQYLSTGDQELHFTGPAKNWAADNRAHAEPVSVPEAQAPPDLSRSALLRDQYGVLGIDKPKVANHTQPPRVADCLQGGGYEPPEIGNNDSLSTIGNVRLR